MHAEIPIGLPNRHGNGTPSYATIAFNARRSSASQCERSQATLIFNTVVPVNV